MVEEAKTAETGLSASSRGCSSTAAKVTEKMVAEARG
jgi:hypothetical protein